MNKKTILIITILSLMLLQSVSAVTYNSITGVAVDGEFRRFTDNIAGTWGTGKIILVDGSGTVKNVSISFPKEIIEECVQDFLDPTMCYYIIGLNLITIDLDAGSFISEALPSPLQKSNIRLMGQTPNEYFFTYLNGTYQWLISKNLTNDDTSSYTLPNGVPELATKGTTGYKIAPMFTTYEPTGYLLWQVYYRQDTDNFYVGAFYDNNTGTESFGYQPVLNENAFCYNEALNDTRNFQDSDFPSNLFANYGYQSGILNIKPSCRSQFTYDVSDKDSVVPLLFPTSYFRDSGFIAIGQPLMIYQSGVLSDNFGNTSAYSQNELFINNSAGDIMFFNGDQYLNQETTIQPYDLDKTNFYGGFSNNIFSTIPLSQSTLIYPTGLYDYTIATNLSTLTETGLTINLLDYSITSSSGNNIDLSFGGDKNSYVLTESSPNSILIKFNTENNSNIIMTFNKTVLTTTPPASLDATGVFSLGSPSINYLNLLIAGNNKIRQLIDYDSTYTDFNYTDSNVKKGFMLGNTGGDGISDALILTDTGTVINIKLAKTNKPYPNATYVATKSTKFAPIDLDYSCTAGSDEMWFAHALSPSGSGLGICFFDRTILEPIILCDSAPDISTETYPYTTKINAISTYGLYFSAYKNSSAIVNGHMASCNLVNSLIQDSFCNVGTQYGTVRSVFRTNNTHSLIGTTGGYIGVCNANTGNVNVVDLGTITADNQTIFSFQSKNNECSGTGCAESNNIFHFISNKYYGIGELSSGSFSSPNFCGDLSCNGGESALTCPVDCSASCGDSYCTHDETSFSCPSDCGGAVCGNNICEGGENITNCAQDCAPIWVSLPKPLSDPITFPASTDLRALEIPSSSGTLIAGIFSGTNKIRKIDLSVTGNLTALTFLDLLDFPYTINYKNDVVYVATDNEVHAVSGYSTDNFALIENRGWNFPRSDVANDVQAINETKAFVCDNFEEPDVYTIGNQPQGNFGGECWAMEYDENNNYLYVDANQDGIRFWDVSDLNSFLLNSTQNYRTESHDLTGDIMDLKEEILLVKRNSQSMTAFNVSTPSNPTIITHCNNGGAGTITSLEIYNTTLAIGGTINGKLSFCDLTDNNETNNTQSFSLDDLYNIKIRAVELDENNTIWLMTSEVLQPYFLNLTGVLNNTAPNITSFTVSSNNVFIGEPVDVQIIAGNVEEADVIKYGVKCEGTETNYDQNSNGEFTCTYNSSGVYNLRVAVSDNYHVGQWFDEQYEEIIVDETIFSGGILRIQVINEQQEAVEGANVTVDGESKLTTIYGDVTFTTDDNGLYEVTTQKDDYYPSIDNFYADSSIHIVNLVGVPTENETVLQVTVVDKNGNKVENALVSYTNTITYRYDYKFTNGFGLAVFRGIDAGTVVIQASKDSNSNSVNTNILSRNINEVEIQVDYTNLPNLHLERNCIDDGIWLCGDVENSCTQDSDCLSDQCTVGTNKCSRFNYTVCDVNGYPRGQTCVIKYSAEATLGNVTDWILDNLLWVIMLMVIVIGVGFIFVSWSPRR